MSDTPLTDAVEKEPSFNTYNKMLNHAHRLERDRARLLAALKVAADQLDLLGYERQAGNAYSVISEVKKSQ